MVQDEPFLCQASRNGMLLWGEDHSVVLAPSSCTRNGSTYILSLPEHW